MSSRPAPSRPRQRGVRFRRTALLSLGAVCLLTTALWAAPVLHEYFDPKAVSVPARPPTPGTDAVAGADGVTPPAANSASRDATSEPTLAAGVNSDPDRYVLDSDTSRPDQVGYSDPFTPAIPPFKRMHAFDSVNEALELVVANQSAVRFKVGGAPSPSDDQFFGDVLLQLAPGELVRVPSVGPGARVLGAKLEPAGQLEFFSDSADNWFLRSDVEGPHRLVVHLAIERAVFGSALHNTNWADLSVYLPPLPRNLQRHAKPVLQRIGVSQNQAPVTATARLIQYFREFAPSEDRSTARGPELYEAIALSQKGVCRHRAFAFVVSALALGIPSRFVHNEAHAWVEVFDTQLWHRIDLGGAAGQVGLSGNLDVPHVAPQDPFPWPANSERGTDMVQDAMGSSGGNAQSQTGNADNPAQGAEAAAPETPAAPASAGANPGAPQPDAPGATSAQQAFTFSAPNASQAQSAEQASAVPSAEAPPAAAAPAETLSILLSVTGSSATRGSRLGVNGRIQASSADCSLQRVNVLLKAADGHSVPIGILVSDARGQFAGEVTVPSSVPVGDYDLYVTTPGNSQCEAASSELSSP